MHKRCMELKRTDIKFIECLNKIINKINAVRDILTNSLTFLQKIRQK